MGGRASCHACLCQACVACKWGIKQSQAVFEQQPASGQGGDHKHKSQIAFQSPASVRYSPPPARSCVARSKTATAGQSGSERGFCPHCPTLHALSQVSRGHTANTSMHLPTCPNNSGEQHTVQSCLCSGQKVACHQDKSADGSSLPMRQASCSPMLVIQEREQGL